MPSISAGGSSVLSRLTGKRGVVADEIITEGYPPSDSSPQKSFSPSTPEPLSQDDVFSPSPISGISDTDARRLLRGHKRESSILSLTDSVNDFSHSVRRSISLRGHRTQASAPSLGHQRWYPSSGNLIVRPPPQASPSERDDTAPSTPISPTRTDRSEQSPLTPSAAALSSPRRPQPRGKLGISARSLSQRFRSSDHSPNASFSSRTDGSIDPPPPVPSIDGLKSPFSMIVAPGITRRPTADRPPLPTQTSFARDGAHGPFNGAPSVTSSTAAAHLSPSGIYQTIHETSAKRMATMEYMRKVHEANVYYFNTLYYTPAALSSIPSLAPNRLGRRATNYLLLGYSLPGVLDLNTNSPMDYLRAMLAVLTEFEAYQNLAGLEPGGSSLSRARVGAMLKSGMGLGQRSGLRSGRRSSAATDSISLDANKASLLGLSSPPSHTNDATSPAADAAPSPVNLGNHEFHHLMTPHIPFEPDFNTTYATLCDTLISSYARLLELVHSPEVCKPIVGDTFAKVDKAVRKILVSNVLREFEDHTRAGAKAEVAGVGRLVLGGLM